MLIHKMNNQFDLRVMIAFAAITLTTLSQTACAPIKASAPQPFEIMIYLDRSIKWLDPATREKLMSEIIAGLSENDSLTKVKVVETARTKKASEIFSEDFDFGPPVKCSVEVPHELIGNVEAERRAREESHRHCTPAIELRRRDVAEQLKRLAEFLNRPSGGLTSCTSFSDFIARIRRDDPAVALVITDGRSNCPEELQTYASEHPQRLVVIQCPAPDGKNEERTSLLKQMLPKARILMMHQASEAMKLLIENQAEAPAIGQ